MAGAPEFIGRIPVRVSACMHVLTTVPDPSPLRCAMDSSSNSSGVSPCSLRRPTPLPISPHISPQVRHGLEPEFIGRIPVRVACQRLREADLFRVLTDAHDSVAAQIVRDFEGCARDLERARLMAIVISSAPDRMASDRAIGWRLIAIVIASDCGRYEIELVLRP